MHHFGAFFKLGLQELSNLWSLNSGLLGKAKLFFVYLLLLSERWARLSNSMGDSSSLVSGGDFRCGCQHIITLISIVCSTQSLEVSLYEDTGFFDFNKFSIIDSSQVRSFQNEDIIRRPDQFENNSATFGGNFFPLIRSDFNSLSINKNFILFILHSIGAGWL